MNRPRYKRQLPEGVSRLDWLDGLGRTEDDLDIEPPQERVPAHTMWGIVWLSAVTVLLIIGGTAVVLRMFETAGQ